MYPKLPPENVSAEYDLNPNLPGPSEVEAPPRVSDHAEAGTELADSKEEPPKSPTTERSVPDWQEEDAPGCKEEFEAGEDTGPAENAGGGVASSERDIPR